MQKIIRFDLSKSFEPVDVVFLSLFEEYSEDLQKTCEKNKLNVKSVKACVAGLYDKSCKRRHVGEYYVAIWAKYWNPNEVVALSLIFKYGSIRYRYINEDGRPAISPYKIYFPIFYL